ncbi:hypothetical protein [Streptomyces phage phiSAJS1]|uniref:hypothetical protein n=1 Tax=Streptomyces phage phiSAJS1 TaxID=1755682 RepID=UPI0007223FA0|nr:hypothetical protein AVT91_p52 [Streptomyces phage phiSAJS1]ALO79368.1 hypothetical protein [Streptomyces phage phiSAJS1]
MTPSTFRPLEIFRFRVPIRDPLEDHDVGVLRTGLRAGQDDQVRGHRVLRAEVRGHLFHVLRGGEQDQLVQQILDGHVRARGVEFVALRHAATSFCYCFGCWSGQGFPALDAVAPRPV